MTPARRAALEVVRALGRGRRLDRAFEAAQGGLTGEQRRWLHELVFGVSRLRGRLDHLLDLRVHRGVESLAPPLVDVLRLGAYQILRMGGVPAYAAVSQSVEQARALGGEGAARLTNAVLREVARVGEDASLFPSAEDDPLGYLSSWGSHPRWLVERWLSRWPFEEVRRLVESNNAIPPLTLMPTHLSAAEAIAGLAEGGVQARGVGRGTGMVEVASGVAPGAALALLNGWVQDPGAALVTLYADPPRGARIADLCAAPGGKALALARHGSYLLAADRSPARLALLRENLVRTGLGAGLVVARAEEPPLRQAEMILLDVPCTGTGTLRRHPDARWRLAPEDVGRMAELQARMLAASAPLVSPGGFLVYSTCTLEREENDSQVERFLAAHPEFALEPSEAVDGALLEHGYLAVLPQHTGFDGAFAARLRRVG